MVLVGIGWRRLVQPGWRTLSVGNSIKLGGNKPKTCGIIVTGNEVLRGEVHDSNSHFLCKRLHDLGVKVVEVSSLPDDVDVISAEVKKFSRAYDYVLTTGGIGPTHDDVTYESVAKAFDVELRHDKVLTKICFDLFKTDDINHPGLKLAYIPATAKLTFGFEGATNRPLLFPNVSVENVHIFPGVPEIMRRLFNAVCKHLFSSDCQYYCRRMFLCVKEHKILGHLNDAVQKFPDVTFGSYPQIVHSYYSVMLTAESINEARTDRAFEYLKTCIPEDFKVEYDMDYTKDKKRKILELNNALLNNTISRLQSDLSEKNPDNIFLYFDGGKNATVLLYIMSLIHEENFNNSQINCVYVVENPKLIPFVTISASKFNVNLIKLNRNNFRVVFQNNSDVVLIKGTRKSDPESERIFHAFEDFHVLNPLADWEYKDVWDVIRGLCIPYSHLYDKGYTSVCLPSSKPNPYLKTTGPRSDFEYYKKAYELLDGSLENSY